MPRFHGRSVVAYRSSIENATATRIDTWPVGEQIRLVDLAQQITLDVIMAAVFGLPDGAPTTNAEAALRTSMTRLLKLSTHPVATIAQLTNSALTMPAMYSPNSTSPCNCNPPSTFRAGMNAPISKA